MVDDEIAFRSTRGMDVISEDALQIGIAIGRSFDRVAVGIDTNPSSDMIRDALIAGLTSAGADVLNVGMAPTPAVCCTMQDSCDCIVMVGEPDISEMVSGISMYEPDGTPYSLMHMESLLNNTAPLPDFSGVGDVKNIDCVIRMYMDLMISEFDDNEGMIVVDCGCGTAGLTVPGILDAHGADVVSVNAQTDPGKGRLSPGIGRARLIALSDIVGCNPDSIGVAINGDGTRIALMDESGKVVDDYMVMALILMHMKPDVAVIPIDTPVIVESAFWGISDQKDGSENNVGRRVIRTEDSIEAVIKIMKANNADVGMTSKGCFIFPTNTYCPDGAAAALELSELSGISNIKRLIESFPTYISRMERIGFDGNIKSFGRKFTEEVQKYNFSHLSIMDGWRLGVSGGWVMVSKNKDDSHMLDVTGEAYDGIYLTSMMELVKSIIRSCI